MLSPMELTSLQNLINEETKTFEDLKNKFNQLFDKSNHFKVYLALSILIRDKQLNLSQEIAAFYILYCIWSLEKDSFPFASLAMESLKEVKVKSEKKLLIDFLENNFKNNQMKIKEFIEINEKNENINLNEDIKFTEGNGKNMEMKKYLNDIKICPFISGKKINDKKNIDNNNINAIFGKERFHYVTPNYMSYYPFNDTLFKQELNWVMPMLKHQFLWENSSYEKVSFLLNQLINDTPLTKDEEKYILSSIAKNPNMIKSINFDPCQMMLLIEKDESLAFEIMAIICKISLNE